MSVISVAPKYCAMYTVCRLMVLKLCSKENVCGRRYAWMAEYDDRKLRHSTTHTEYVTGVCVCVCACMCVCIHVACIEF